MSLYRIKSKTVHKVIYVRYLYFCASMLLESCVCLQYIGHYFASRSISKLYTALHTIVYNKYKVHTCLHASFVSLFRLLTESLQHFKSKFYCRNGRTIMELSLLKQKNKQKKTGCDWSVPRNIQWRKKSVQSSWIKDTTESPQCRDWMM